MLGRRLRKASGSTWAVRYSTICEYTLAATLAFPLDCPPLAGDGLGELGELELIRLVDGGLGVEGVEGEMGEAREARRSSSRRSAH